MARNSGLRQRLSPTYLHQICLCFQRRSSITCSFDIHSMNFSDDDLQERVEMTLARFDDAVKEMANSTKTIVRHEHQPWNVSDNTVADVGKQSQGGNGIPNCRPWDYDDFTSRLQTFTPLMWFAKPSAASPLMCARHGWINKGRDVLACPCCGKELHYKDTQDDKDVPFSSRLTSAHHALCPWNGNACPVEFLQLPVRTVDDLRTEFQLCLESLVHLVAAAALPELSLPSDFEEHCPGGLPHLAAKTRALVTNTPGDSAAPPVRTRTARDYKNDSKMSGENTEKWLSDENVGISTLADTGDEVLGVAAAVVLFGWRLVPPPSSATISSSTSKVEVTKASNRVCCELCNRRVAVDNFLTLSVTATPQKSSEPDARSDIDEYRGLTTGASTSRSRSSTSPKAGGDGVERVESSKRRRLSGGGTPLKPMDLVAEHRSFCPWARVHPIQEGGNATEGTGVPGWRRSLDAVLFEEAALSATSQSPLDSRDRGDPPQNEAAVALQQVQKILGVLTRY